MELSRNTTRRQGCRAHTPAAVEETRGRRYLGPPLRRVLRGGAPRDPRSLNGETPPAAWGASFTVPLRSPPHPSGPTAPAPACRARRGGQSGRSPSRGSSRRYESSAPLRSARPDETPDPRARKRPFPPPAGRARRGAATARSVISREPPGRKVPVLARVGRRSSRRACGRGRGPARDWRGAAPTSAAGPAHAPRATGPCPRCVCMRVSPARSAEAARALPAAGDSGPGTWDPPGRVSGLGASAGPRAAPDTPPGGGPARHGLTPPPGREAGEGGSGGPAARARRSHPRAAPPGAGRGSRGPGWSEQAAARRHFRVAGDRAGSAGGSRRTGQRPPLATTPTPARTRAARPPMWRCGPM